MSLNINSGRGLVSKPSAASETGDQPVSTAGLQRRLYVANDSTGKIDIFDLNDNHKYLRSINLAGNLKRFRGITVHPPSNRMYVTDSSKNVVVAIDMKTEQEVWRKKYTGSESCGNPDRLSVTMDGEALYIPCKDDNRYLIVDTDGGGVIKKFAFPNAPHNTFVGQNGKNMYITGYRNKTVQVWDTETHTKIKDLEPFSAGVRPFVVDPEEKYLYANLTPLLGFGQADIETGRKIGEFEQKTPAERLAHPRAGLTGDQLPHGGHPKSHGIAMRPGHDEVWFLDDGWGYLYAYDTSTEIPTRKAIVPLFDDITKLWGHHHFRWVAFSIDGKYVYPSDGSVWDADTKTKMPFKVPASEKMIEVDFSADGTQAIQNSGQNGGAYTYSADQFEA